MSWHIAAMTRVKKMPKLKDLMAGEKRPPRRQSIDEQIAIAKQWTIALSRKR